MAQSKTTNLSFILLKCTFKNKQKIRETDTLTSLMSPVTCFHRILSHDVCKPVMEALRSSLRSVAGEVMGTGENGTREGHPLLSSACFAGHFVSLSNKFTDIM